VNTTGGVTTTPGTTTTTVSSSPQPQQVTITTSNGPITGTLPAGESIPAGTSVALIPSGTPFIQGLSLSSFNGHGTHVTPASKAKPQGGTQGQIWVDGVNTGLTVDSDGSISGYLILTAGQHTITAYGPFAITGGSVFHPTQLTVGQFNFGVVVLADGNVSVPVGLKLNLPSNGGSWAHGPHVTTTYPTPDFATGSGSLTIVVDSSKTIFQSKALSSGVATFDSLGISLGTHTIPVGGVDTVTFNYSQ